MKNFIFIFLVLAACTPKESNKSPNEKIGATKSQDSEKENHLKLKEVASEVRRALMFSWAEWGEYPSKIKYQISDTPEEATLHLKEEPVILGEKVVLEIIESGKNGKIKITWRDKTEIIESNEK